MNAEMNILRKELDALEIALEEQPFRSALRWRIAEAIDDKLELYCLRDANRAFAKKKINWSMWHKLTK